jgi:hypothetical protein
MDEHQETLPSSKCSRTPQPIAQRRNEAAAAEEDHEGSGAAGKNNLLKEGEGATGFIESRKVAA